MLLMKLMKLNMVFVGMGGEHLSKADEVGGGDGGDGDDQPGPQW